MGYILAQCQPIQAEIDQHEDEKRDWREELKTATGQHKAVVASRSKKLNKEISEAERRLAACIAAAPRRETNLSIAAIEATQGIQYFRPGVNITHPAGCSSIRVGVQPENGIGLVAGKTTILRVYVDTTTDPSAPIVNRLNGVLESSSWGPPLTPYNALVAPRGLSAISRLVADHTMNFRIPAAYCQGSFEVKVTAHDSAHPGETGFMSKPEVMTLRFATRSPLRIRLVRIRYANASRGMDVAAPTVADFWRTAEYVLRTFPIPGIALVADTEELYDGDFTDISPGGNRPGTPNWGTTGTILNILDRLVAAENLDPCVRYVALIPGPPANQSPNSGWGVGRLAVSNALSGSTLAHELGHTFGRQHAPCGVAGDACYPAYGTHPPVSIGEVGFDYATSQVFDPATTKDFMSYCGPTWISPYTYEAIMGANCLAAPGLRGAAAEIQGPPRPRALLHLSFTRHRDDAIVLKSPSFHREGLPAEPIGPPSPYLVELRDKEGRVLEARRVHDPDNHSGPDDPSAEFSVDLPWHESAARVVFTRDGREIHSTGIEDEAPRVKLEAPSIGEAAVATGRRAVSISSERREPSGASRGPHEPPDRILRYSNDGGTTWLALAAGGSGDEWEVDFDRLPGGDHCLIQVLASSGFRTASAVTGPFAVPRKPRVPSILSPGREEAFDQGEPVRLFGYAFSPEGSSEPEDLTWFSSVNGFLGSGPEIIVHNLSVGRHRITLRAYDGFGCENVISVTLVVRPGEAL